MKLVVSHSEKLPTPEEVAALSGFSEFAKFFSSVGGDSAALEVARAAAKLSTPEPSKKEGVEKQKEGLGEKVPIRGSFSQRRQVHTFCSEAERKVQRCRMHHRSCTQGKVQNLDPKVERI